MTSKQGDLAKQPGNATISLSIEQLSSLLGLIHTGAINPLPWSKAVSELHRLLGASWVTLVLRPADNEQAAIMVNMGREGPPHLAASAHVRFSAFILDPFVNLPANQVVTVDDVVGEQAWLASEYYKNFCERAGARYVMGADIHTNNGSQCRLRICRPAGARPFSDADKALCGILIPHFEAAVELYCRIDATESERQLLDGTVDRMLVGTVILDEIGNVLRANKAANYLLKEADGLRVLKGMLRVDFGAEHQEFSKLLKATLNASAGPAGVAHAMSVTRPSGRSKLGITMRSVPIRGGLESRRRPTVAVFIRDPESPPYASMDMIRKMFGLTRAETSLAMLLVGGLSLEEAAIELGITKNTTRAQLRHVFAKTGVSRQNALIRLLLSSATPE